MESPEGRWLRPEERELARKEAELTQLQADVQAREAALAALQTELNAFEERYLATVGRRYTELDELLSRREVAAQPPSTAAETHDTLETTLADAEIAAPVEEAADEPSRKLRTLYRELAKVLHPDLAHPEARAQREVMMAEANAAYEAHDAVRLTEMLRQWDTSPEAVTGEGIGTDLVRCIRRIALAEERLSSLEAQMQQVQASELAALRARVAAAEEAGIDLLANMAARLDLQIAELCAQTDVTHAESV